MISNPLYDIDFYKVGHVSQYPADTTQVWSNWTPRSTRVAGENSVVFYGLQYFIKEILKRWDVEFFGRRIGAVLDEYREVMRATLGVQEPKVDHLEALWRIGYLPLDIYALPEGDSVPLGVPALVITNTHPSAFWLPNYLETILSNILWKPCTSASTARRYRKLFEKYARESGETDLSFVDWMGHDFSMRGMSGREDSILSGMGHLLSFSGTDSVPAILAAKKYYGAELNCGGSVPATEHSVMSAGTKDGEFETFRHIIEDVYPTGVVSIVSDTWDLWKVLTDFIPRLRESILARNGKVVIRPDSGDPVKIICGDPDKTGPSQLGTLELLVKALGWKPSTTGGLPLINNAGAIYGDSITVERADQILNRMVNELKLSPYNMVFGIGSYTYEYVTRDTYGFAMKATAVRRGGELMDIFKCPVTDDGGKVSHKGIPAVYLRDSSNEYFCVQGSQPSSLDSCAFAKVYSNGNLLVEHTFDEIRKRVRR